MSRFREAVSRANSHFRYWAYRRSIGNSISIMVPLRQWPRRFAFEFFGIGTGA